MLWIHKVATPKGAQQKPQGPKATAKSFTTSSHLFVTAALLQRLVLIGRQYAIA